MKYLVSPGEQGPVGDPKLVPFPVRKFAFKMETLDVLRG
jgi:hypothetical protein